MIDRLNDYIVASTERGECQCGRCADKGPDRLAPAHSVNVHFFWVSLKGQPHVQDLKSLLEAEYPNLDRLHQGLSYIEIGGELGSQDLALRLIGLGGLLRLWSVVTPATLLAEGQAADELAGAGFVMSGGFA